MPDEGEKKTGFFVDIKWLVTAIAIPMIAWCVSIEVRLSSGMPGRVATLEKALEPVLIEYGVRQELAKRGNKEASPVLTDDQNETKATKPENEPILKEQKKRIMNQFPNMKKGD